MSATVQIRWCVPSILTAAQRMVLARESGKLMLDRKPDLSDASMQRQVALSRWENEGGAAIRPRGANEPATTVIAPMTVKRAAENQGTVLSIRGSVIDVH